MDHITRAAEQKVEHTHRSTIITKLYRGQTSTSKKHYTNGQRCSYPIERTAQKARWTRSPGFRPQPSLTYVRRGPAAFPSVQTLRPHSLLKHRPNTKLENSLRRQYGSVVCETIEGNLTPCTYIMRWTIFTRTYVRTSSKTTGQSVDQCKHS